MGRRRRLSVVALLGAVAVVAGGGAASQGADASTARAGVCSTATASGSALLNADPTFVPTGPQPFGVAATGGYAFVALSQGRLDVFNDRGAKPRLLHTIDLPHSGVGASLTGDGRYLLIADGLAGATVVDVARAEAGSVGAVLGTLSMPASTSAAGAIEVAASPDGQYAFVSAEDSGEIAVYRLSKAIADHFKRSFYVGSIPTGVAPVGLEVSSDGRWLYSTSELARERPASSGEPGSGILSVISVAEAGREPGHSIVATVSAECSPVRVALSPDGSVAWVTARESDELLAFSTSRLIHHQKDALLAAVRVGEAPVGLVLVDGGRYVVVADSNRFDQDGEASGLMVVKAAAALAHKSAIVGTVKAGLFPREMAVAPSGSTLFVGNFASGTLEAVRISEL